ncbi:MAG: hypothetical protein ACOX61_03380 [Brooklawnia sp.]|jgi:hypothetical protein
MLFGIVMNFWISLFLSFFMSIATPVVTGTPMTLMGILVGTGLGTVIGTVFSSVVPVNPIGQKWAESVGAKPGTVAWFLLKDVALVTMMLLAITFFLTWIMTGLDAGLVSRWLGPAPQLWGIAYVLIILVEPVCLWLTRSMVKPPEAIPAAAATSHA